MEKLKYIKWENIFLLLYIVITSFKYFITLNNDIIILLIDLFYDSILLFFVYEIMKDIRKEIIKK